MCKVLVIIDMQKKFIETCRAGRIVPRVVEKIERRKAEGYEIVATYDLSGGETVEGVADAAEGCRIYEKRSYGCKRLILDLCRTNPDRIEFVGVCTDICVIANVLGVMAFLPFAEISVDASCCASSPRGHRAALEIFRACNVKVE